MTRALSYLLLLCLLLNACSKSGESEPAPIPPIEQNNDPETCDGLITLSLDGVEGVTANISWSTSASFTTYELEYGPNGFTLGQGTGISLSGTETVLDDLDPDSDYEVYLRGDCNNIEGDWSDALSFSTGCDSGYFDGSVVLESQEAVNDFGALCHSGITGALTLRSYTPNDPITDLTPLMGIIELTGDLIIQENPELMSLTGLESIEKINHLRVYRNHGLTSLKGLDGLSEITGLFPTVETDLSPGIRIDSNNKLLNLEGLEGIEQAGLVRIRLNHALTSLKGLDNLKNVDQDFRIYQNIALTTLEALSNLVSVGGDFDIHWHPDLLSLDGLERLESVGENLLIFNNEKLMSIEAIGNMTDAKDLTIDTNVSLTDLTGVNIEVISGTLWLAYIPATSLATIAGTSTNGTLRIRFCHELTTMEGLEAITDLGMLLIMDNKKLVNLDGLDGLLTVADEIRIERNELLADYCGLNTLINSGSFSGEWLVSDNLLNPTFEEMQGGTCD